MKKIRIGKGILTVAVFHTLFCTMIWGQSFWAEAELDAESHQQLINKILWLVGGLTYLSHLTGLYEYYVGRMETQMRIQKRLTKGLEQGFKKAEENGGFTFMGCGDPDCENCKAIQEDMDKGLSFEEIIANQEKRDQDRTETSSDS